MGRFLRSDRLMDRIRFLTYVYRTKCLTLNFRASIDSCMSIFRVDFEGKKYEF